MVALLWAEGKREAALRLEHLWNDLAQTHAFSLRCAYPLRFFGRVGDAESIGAICAVHSGVIPAESYTALCDEEERLRAITLLQQKAQALETEIEERKKANQQLRAAAAARDGFLSMAAHELKTPITSLRGFAQLLLHDVRRKRQIAPDRLASALETIDRQTRKLNQLVARLLDTAQNEAGALRIEPVSTDLVALVHAAFAPYHDYAHHSFVFEGPAQLQIVVDPVRFEQVLTNLLDNAVKFSPDGGRVTVGLGQDDDGGIRLSVTDEGVGIPPEQREAVFERFHQAHGTQHLSGLGLGLYITREIVTLHGGRVWIEEPAHQGTRVVVALPACGAQTG
jgi:signal transduction histidine kinase